MEHKLIIQAQKDPKLKNDVIEMHIPLVIHTLSNVMGRYITIEDNEYSIGLLALNEAIDKYKPEKGSFSNFATLIIKNRVIDELRKENKLEIIPLEEHHENIEVHLPDMDLKEEIESISVELKKFCITFEDLVESSPSHYDTRIRCAKVSKKSSSDEGVMILMYKHFKLPIKEIMMKFLETKRFLYNNKAYITCLVLVFYKNYESIKYWVHGTIRDDMNESV